MCAPMYSSEAPERIGFPVKRHHGLSGSCFSAIGDPNRRRYSCFALANWGTLSSLRAAQSRFASA